MRGLWNRALAAVSAVIITAGSLVIPASASGTYYDFDSQLVQISRGESITMNVKGGTYPAVYVVGNKSKDSVVGVEETRAGHYKVTFYCGADETASGYTVYFYKGYETKHQHHDVVNVHVKENQQPAVTSTASTGTETKAARSFATTYAGFNQEIASDVRRCAVGGTVTVEAGPWTSLYRTAVQAITERPDVTVVVRFTFENTRLQIEIPAESHIETRLDANGCIGFAGLYADYAVEYSE